MEENSKLVVEETIFATRSEKMVQLLLDLNRQWKEIFVLRIL
jgi:hypothetical protein